jgi:hypothetical protein
LRNLHQILQLAMGWSDSHAHEFSIDRVAYGPRDEEEFPPDQEVRDEAKVTLADLTPNMQPSFFYIYDFGDDWVHEIVIEKVLPPGTGKPYPRLLGGQRACPPEDVGGPPGYNHLLKVLADQTHDDYDEMIEWVGDDFAPETFGKEEITFINSVLKDVFSPTSGR